MAAYCPPDRTNKQIWNFSSLNRGQDLALRLYYFNPSTQLEASGAITLLPPYAFRGWKDEILLLHISEEAGWNNSRSCRLRARILPRPKIDPRPFRRAASNPVTVRTPQYTCIYSNNRRTSTVQQPTQHSKETFGKLRGYSEIRVDFSSLNKSLAVRLCDICCSIEENRTKGELMWSHTHTQGTSKPA